MTQPYFDPIGQRYMQCLPPSAPPDAFKTYGMSSPSDLYVKVACELVDCPDWTHGWETFVDERTDLGMMQAQYIRQASGRTFRESKTEAGITVFRFESGQRCFGEHATRPERFYVHDGDFRGATGPTRVHQRPADWVEDFAEHQIKVAEQVERG